MDKKIKPIIQLFIFIFIYLLILYYPISRLGILIGVYSSILFQELIILLLILPLISILISRIIRTKITEFISIISMFWLGISFIMFSLFLIFEILNIIFNLNYFLSGLTIITIVFFLTIIGIYNGNTFNIKIININSEKITKKIRVVQLTDIHLGSRSSRFLEKIVLKVNLLNPDFIVITGDLIDVKVINEAELFAFKNIKVPIYFVIGNHERYENLENILRILKNLKINVLRNEFKINSDIQFIGIDDSDDKNQVKNKLKNIKVEKNKYSILLYHKPDGFIAAQEKKIDLKLAGHTHAGQIFPFNFLVKLQFKEVVGLFEKNNSKMYVSPGTGTWGPILRLGTKNEITVLI